jgi:hypothetical protein
MRVTQEEANELLAAHDSGEYSEQIRCAIDEGDDQAAVLERLCDQFIEDRQTVVGEGDDSDWDVLRSQGVTAEHVETWLQQVWDEIALELD